MITDRIANQKTDRPGHREITLSIYEYLEIWSQRIRKHSQSNAYLGFPTVNGNLPLTTVSATIFTAIV